MLAFSKLYEIIPNGAPIKLTIINERGETYVNDETIDIYGGNFDLVTFPSQWGRYAPNNTYKFIIPNADFDTMIRNYIVTGINFDGTTWLVDIQHQSQVSGCQPTLKQVICVLGLHCNIDVRDVYGMSYTDVDIDKNDHIATNMKLIETYGNLKVYNIDCTFDSSYFVYVVAPKKNKINGTTIIDTEA